MSRGDRSLRQAGVIFGGLLVLFVAAQLAPGGVRADLLRWLQHVRDLGPAGSLLLMLAQVGVTVSGVLPAALLGIAAGSTYGLLPGFALAAVSTLLGAVVAFSLGRWLCRPAVARMLQSRRRLRVIDARLADDGWRTVLLLRLSPVMPFSITSYALGLSSVRLRDYVLGTLACLPALAGYVAIGAAATAGLDAGAAVPVRGVLFAFGAAATVFLVVRLGRLVARAGIVEGEGLASDAGGAPLPTA